MAADLEVDARGRRAVRARARFTFVLTLLGLAWVAFPGIATETTPLVIVADVGALIHPVSAEYMVEAIDRADAERAALIVFILETPEAWSTRRGPS